jgi:hypothetical protein
MLWALGDRPGLVARVEPAAANLDPGGTDRAGWPPREGQGRAAPWRPTAGPPPPHTPGARRRLGPRKGSRRSGSPRRRTRMTHPSAFPPGICEAPPWHAPRRAEERTRPTAGPPPYSGLTAPPLGAARRPADRWADVPRRRARRDAIAPPASAYEAGAGHEPAGMGRLPLHTPGNGDRWTLPEKEPLLAPAQRSRGLITPRGPRSTTWV